MIPHTIIQLWDTTIKNCSCILLLNDNFFNFMNLKVDPVNQMVKYLPKSVEIIGTHPMFGPDSGKNGVKDLPLVFCPIRLCESNESFWRKYFLDLGLKIIDLTPDEHDLEAAYTQGITHFLGRILNDMELKDSKIATLGYQKLLDIIEQTCNDPYQLFIDLQMRNPHTNEMRNRLSDSFSKFMDILN